MKHILKHPNGDTTTLADSHKDIIVNLNYGDKVEVIKKGNGLFKHIGKKGIIVGYSFARNKAILKELETNKQFSVCLSYLQKIPKTKINLNKAIKELEKIEKRHSHKTGIWNGMDIWEYIAMQINSYSGEQQEFWECVMDLYNEKKNN